MPIDLTAARENFQELRQLVAEIVRSLTAEVTFGYPVDEDGSSSRARVGQMYGNWVTVTLTAAATNVSCVHNLDIPTTTVGANSALPANVRWFVFGVEYGDKAGASAAPAAPAAFNLSVLRMVNAALSRDAITLRFLVTGVVPSATEPVIVTLWFQPVVR